MRTKDLLIQSREEILQLRRRNEILSAKVEIVDLFACVLHTKPATPSYGESVDVAWEIQRAIDEMNMAEELAPDEV